MISHIEPGSPAEASGFELGGLVCAVEAPGVRTGNERTARAGGGGGVEKTFEFTVVRDGVEMVLEAAA